MNQEQWTAVDVYLSTALLLPDPALETTRLANSRAGLPAIDVSPCQGKLLYLLALMLGARRILEIGTLGGYSTIWLAKALPADGLLVTLEADPKHALVAQQNIDRAGFGQLVRILIGEALKLLPKVTTEYQGAFDLIFIDADKASTSEYFRWALALSHTGTVIIVDNVVRKGEIANVESTDPSVQGMRRLTEMLAAESNAFTFFWRPDGDCELSRQQQRGAFSTRLPGVGARSVFGGVGSASNTHRELSILRRPAGTATAPPDGVAKAGTASWAYHTFSRVLSPPGLVIVLKTDGIVSLLKGVSSACQAAMRQLRRFVEKARSPGRSSWANSEKVASLI